MKTISANWDESGDIIDECIELGFHHAFSISEDEFRNWLNGETPATYLPIIYQDQVDEDSDEEIEFQFSNGHASQAQEIVRVSNTRRRTIHLLHNELETKLFNHLVGIHGDVAVGTEVALGRTKIDIVVKTSDENYIFYEIKTDDSVKSSIRQAVSQLLEYAYWPIKKRGRKTN